MDFKVILLFILQSVIMVTPLLFDRELEIINSKWSDLPVAVRHVEFIGTVDNGTLDCFIPGFKKYRWEFINKASAGPFAESASLIHDEEIKEHQTEIRIGKGGIPMATEMLVVSCEAMIGNRPRFQIIWVITRLHSPLGYPTDPRVCFFHLTRYEKLACDDLKWWFNTDCYYNKGKEYRGTAYITNSNPPLHCQYWYQGRPNSGSSNYKVDFGKEHRYCRNPTNEHTLWCITTSTKRSLRKQYCVVQECSDCMYGNGDGTFDVYNFVNYNTAYRIPKFPKYEGRLIETLKEDENGVPRLCMSGKGWEFNLCRPRSGMTGPHCLIAKKKSEESLIKSRSDSRLEWAECRIPQCTVRQVWFLFFNSFGQPYLKESNMEDVEIIIVNGKKSETIKFAAFGIHRATGLRIGTEELRLVKYAQSFILKPRVPPSRLSIIDIRDVTKKYSGKYFVQYTFVEGNSKIQQTIYKGNFKLIVREPMKLSITPSKLELCPGERGSMEVQVSGGFKLMEGSIRWKYGYSQSNTNRQISIEDQLFELSADLKKITIKKIQKDTWITVYGSSFAGEASNTAQFKVKAPPHIIAKSPTQVFVFQGDEVYLTVDSERGFVTTWTFEAQVIADVPDDPEMAFLRTLQNNTVSETLVITSVEWRHFGIYAVETEKDGCKKTVTFHLQQDEEREIGGESGMPEEEIDNIESPVEDERFCTARHLNFSEYQQSNYSTSWMFDIPCGNEEGNVQENNEPYGHPIKELSLCSVITSYSFISDIDRPHKLYIRVNESSPLEEYVGTVNFMKTGYFQSSSGHDLLHYYYFPEPVAARFIQFTADQVEDSMCLSKLAVSGCSLVKSECKPESFTVDSILCNDMHRSMLKEGQVKKMPACSLITSYQFQSNGRMRHILLTSNSNSMVLTEYDGYTETKVEQAGGEWFYNNTLNEPIAARYIQIVPDRADKSRSIKNLQINGCRLDKEWCSIEWEQFRELEIKCNEGEITPVYSEHPLFGFPSCSLISSYQFIARTQQHALLLSGNNPALLSSFREGLDIESYHWKDEEWIFVCKLKSPVAARYLQFLCGETRNLNATCVNWLTITGCPVENSWCREQSFKTVIEEYLVESDYFDTGMGRALLQTAGLSVLTPLWMFLVGKYNLDRRFIKFISEFLRRVLKSIKRVEKGDCTEKEKLSGEFQEDCVVEGKLGREGEEDGKQKETTDDDCDGETE